MLTFNDLLEELKHEDEVTLLELLNLDSNDLVDILESYIFDRQDKLRAYYGESSEELGEQEIAN